MLQATIYAHRSALDAITRTEPADWARPASLGSALSRWISSGRSLLQGRSCETLDPHVLDDIGLSRADLEAMSL